MSAFLWVGKFCQEDYVESCCEIFGETLRGDRLWVRELAMRFWWVNGAVGWICDEFYTISGPPPLSLSLFSISSFSFSFHSASLNTYNTRDNITPSGTATLTWRYVVKTHPFSSFLLWDMWVFFCYYCV